MKNIKIASKLITSFLIIIFLSIVIGAFGIIGMYMMNEADDGLYNGNYLPTVLAGDISQIVVQQRVNMRNLVIYDVNTDVDEFKSAENNMTSLQEEMEQLLIKYDGTIVSNEDRNTFNDFSKTYKGEWLSLINTIYSLGKDNHSEEAKVMLTTQGTVLAKTMDELTSKLQNINLADGKIAVDGNTALFKRMTIISVVLLILSSSIAMFLAIYISKLIGQPINKMVIAANAIAIGDMNVDVSYESRDEVGIMSKAFKQMIHSIEEQVTVVETLANGDLTCEYNPHCDRDKMGISLQKLIGSLNEIFSEINSSTAQVAIGSRQVAEGAQSLAQGSTEQASAVEQLSSSINEIAQKTQENTDQAIKAANLSGTIKQNAEKGSSQMSSMMEAVKEINDASNSIGKIIKVIDDIAFQTNILALNAAVEAARAGQHGKGFAVVAEEVRNLAAKSAEAAKDTGEMIANSIEKAHLGAKIADDTAQSLNEIVTGINESTEIVNDIATSSEKQSAGIKQINLGIDQVAQVVQQNSATAEESAAASEEMSSQADILEQLVAQFKLKGNVESFSHSNHSNHSKPKISMLGIGEQEDYGKY